MNILFDIGGTSTRVAAMTEEGMSDVVFAQTPKTPEEGVALVRELSGKLPLIDAITAVYGCVPGTPRQDGSLFKIPNLPAWDGFAFAQKLSHMLDAPVSVEHDANLGALGEAVYGAGKGFENVVYYGIGTGVGVGHIVNGKIQSPITGFETGHQVVDVAHSGQLTNLVSGKPIVERCGIEPKDAPRSVYDELTPFLAAGMYNSALHWQPDVFVLGGSLMNEENGYRLADIITAFEKLPPYFERAPEIRVAALRGEENLWGARVLAERAVI